MTSETQRRIALRRKLRVLRALTNSKSVKKSSIIMDAFLYIYKLKLQVEAIRKEYLNLINHIQEVQVEKLETGQLIVKITCKKVDELLVSILEAFEEININVLQAKVTCKHFFGMEAIVESDNNNNDNIDPTVLSEAILNVIRKKCC